MSQKVIVHPLKAPRPEEMVVSQAVLDWLEPRGKLFLGRTDEDVRGEVAQNLAKRLGGTQYKSRVERWLELWIRGRTNPPKGMRSAPLVALQLEAHQVFGGQISHLGQDALRDDVQSLRVSLKSALAWGRGRRLAKLQVRQKV